MSELTVSNVAKWYLSKASMTPKKLQKIVYYAYAWFLTLMNEAVENLDNRLFDSHFEAWVHGPVCPSLYQEYRSYGFQEIPMNKDEKISFEPEVEDVLEQVWEVYGGYSASQLESISHQESPWRNARKGCAAYDICTNRITDADMYLCYIERVM